MALKGLLVTLAAIVASSAAANTQTAQPTGAPAGDSNTKYCLRVDPMTGSRMETVQCRTREDWASLDIDVDQEWAENGVRVINA